MIRPNISPYFGLSSDRFWKSGVSEQHPLNVRGLYTKKFRITQAARVATAGSCFAQHIGFHLREAGYNVLDAEPLPEGISESSGRDYGYGVYSARYGNIYLAAQLLQVLQEAFGLYAPAEPVWEKGGRYYDAMRPSVEPYGLSSPEEVMAHRGQHLAAVRSMVNSMDLFIFTFGLTEGWVHKATGTTYPTAPGTIAGSYDPEIYAFKNFKASEIRRDFLAARDLIREINPKCKFLITVSPVPLTATATDQHVLCATTYSKSVLRCVAGELFDRYRDIDYFPSYELISAPFSRGMFYSQNLRTVESEGVLAVMRLFFAEHPKLARRVIARKPEESLAADEVKCDEALLEAFSK